MSNGLKTLCRGCGFASIEDGKQVGCKLGRLEQFKKAGVEIEELEDQTLRVHSFCNKARHPSWVEKFGDEAYFLVEKECIPKIDVVIIFLEHQKKEDLVATIESIDTQTLKFNSVKIVLKNSQIKIKEASELCSKLTTPYFVSCSLNKDQNKWTAIDEIVKRCDGEYYLVVNPGEIIPSDVVEILNKAYNEELRRIVLLNPEDHYPLLIHMACHKKLGGNEEDLISDKINDMISKESQFRIKWSDIWNCHKSQ